MLPAFGPNVARVNSRRRARPSCSARQEERARQLHVADERPLVGRAALLLAAIRAEAGERDDDARRIRVAVVAGALAPDEARLGTVRLEDVAGDRLVRVERDRPALAADVLADQRAAPVGRDLQAGRPAAP